MIGVTILPQERNAMQNVEMCPSRYEGLRCELPAGHDGKHGEVLSRDEEGRVDDAVVWA